MEQLLCLHRIENRSRACSRSLACLLIVRPWRTTRARLRHGLAFAELERCGGAAARTKREGSGRVSGATAQGGEAVGWAMVGCVAYSILYFAQRGQLPSWTGWHRTRFSRQVSHEGSFLTVAVAVVMG